MNNQDPQPVLQTRESRDALTPQQALDLLKEGNRRFVEGRMLTANRDMREQARDTAPGQYPYALILSCQDSRTSSEVLFDLNKGDAFSIRIAGNIVNEDILGGMEFGLASAGAKLLAVIGHTQCGAIRGLINSEGSGDAPDELENKGAADSEGSGEAPERLENLKVLLSKIKPAIQAVPPDVQPRNLGNSAYVNRAVEENVRLVVKQIRERSPVLKRMADEGRIRIVGGISDLATGEVTFYEDE